MEPSSAPIPREKLQIWNIFRDVGPEGEEILKLAKLAHVANEEEAFVVTTADETYSFLRDDDGVCKVTQIPELCHVQVKEFVTGSISLALTEDGRLYSWINNFTSGAEIDANLKAQLARYAPSNLSTDRNFVGRPESVCYAKTEKIVQVALSEVEVVAVTAGAEVYHWGPGGANVDLPETILTPTFDYQEVICVACGVGGLSFALSEDGEVFEWKFGTDYIRRSAICSTPIKKIAATKIATFALTAEGTIHACRKVSSEDVAVWAEAPQFQNAVQDIATCFTGNVLVIKLKNGRRVAWDLTTGEQSALQFGSVDEYFADLCQTSHRTIGARSTKRPLQRGTLGLEMFNLWNSKDDVDVTFSVEGKTITAHKLILKLRSDYFAKMFSNEWNEATTESPIQITGTKYVTFEAFLFYLYHDKVTFAEGEYGSVFDLMKLADSYCATSIARDCEKILIRGINAENAFFLVRNASSANAPILEAQVLKFIMCQLYLFNLKNMSAHQLIELIGQEAFNNVGMALIYLFSFM